MAEFLTLDIDELDPQSPEYKLSPNSINYGSGGGGGEAGSGSGGGPGGGGTDGGDDDGMGGVGGDDGSGGFGLGFGPGIGLGDDTGFGLGFGGDVSGSEVGLGFGPGEGFGLGFGGDVGLGDVSSSMQAMAAINALDPFGLVSPQAVAAIAALSPAQRTALSHTVANPSTMTGLAQGFMGRIGKTLGTQLGVSALGTSLGMLGPVGMGLAAGYGMKGLTGAAQANAGLSEALGMAGLDAAGFGFGPGIGSQSGGEGGEPGGFGGFGGFGGGTDGGNALSAASGSYASDDAANDEVFARSNALNYQPQLLQARPQTLGYIDQLNQQSNRQPRTGYMDTLRSQ